MSALPDKKTAQLNELLEKLISRRLIKQAIIALENTDRSVRWIGTAGTTDQDNRPVGADTPFFIASIDKLYNASIVMILNENEQLDLDESILKYLPEKITQRLHTVNGVDLTEQITLRHLLSHTSGLADWLEDYPKGGQSLINRLLEKNDMAFTMEDLAAVVRDQLKPHFPPQDLSSKRPMARYSDTNFMLIIAIIESVTGKPLHEIYEELLLKPLGLRHTYFPGLSEPMDPTPAAMILRANGRPMQIPRLMRSIRGIYSTVGDSIEFLRRFICNDIFRSPDTLGKMLKNWNRFGIPLDRAALRAPGWPIEYGLGIMRFRLPRLITPFQAMPPVIGHTGSTGCWLFWCADLDMFLTGSVDEAAAGAVPYRIVPKILKILGSSNQE